MPRDMSYRKPVPVYVPSPPASPIEGLTTAQILRSPPAIDVLAPPLPDNWRETILRKTTPPLPCLNDEEHVPPKIFPLGGLEPASSLSVDLYEGRADEGLLVSSSFRTASRASERRVRSIHQQCRPPTPPLPKSPSQPYLDADVRDMAMSAFRYPAPSMRTSSSLTMKTFTLPVSSYDSNYLAAQPPMVRSMTFTTLIETNLKTVDLKKENYAVPVLDSPTSPFHSSWRRTAKTWAMHLQSRLRSWFTSCHRGPGAH